MKREVHAVLYAIGYLAVLRVVDADLLWIDFLYDL